MKINRRTTSKPVQFQAEIQAESLNSYIDLDVVVGGAVGSLSPSLPTGLPNTTEVFGFTLDIGVTTQTVSFQGNFAQTIGDMINEINADLTDGTAILLPEDKRIRIQANTAGLTAITAPATDNLSQSLSSKSIAKAEWLPPVVGGGACFRLSSAAVTAIPMPMVSVLRSTGFLAESAFSYAFDAATATIVIAPVTAAFQAGDIITAFIGLYNRN